MSRNAERNSLLVLRAFVACALLLGVTIAWVSFRNPPAPTSATPTLPSPTLAKSGAPVAVSPPHGASPTSPSPSAPVAVPPTSAASPATSPGPTVDIRFQDLVSGVVEMEGDATLRVTPEQARRMRADMEQLRRQLNLLFIVQVRLNRLLREDQWAFAWERRWSDLTRLDVPVPPRYLALPDPVKTVTWALALVEDAARKPAPGASSGPYHRPRNDEELSWFHISQAIILFSARHPQLAVTPSQAAEMRRFMQHLDLATRSIKTLEERLVRALTPPQKVWILEQKHRKATREQEGHPILDARSQPSVAQALDIIRDRAAAPR